MRSTQYLGRKIVMCAIGVAIAATGFIVGEGSTASAAPAPAMKTPSVLGMWSNAWGKIQVISTGATSYEMKVVAPTELFPSSSCHLAKGASEGTFTGSKSPYSGEINLFNSNSCALVGSDSMSVTLSGNRLTLGIPQGSFIWTRMGTASGGLGKWRNSLGEMPAP